MAMIWIYLDTEGEILSLQINGPRPNAGVDDYPDKSYGIYRNMKTGQIEGWIVFECISWPERSLPLDLEKESPCLDINFRQGWLRGAVAGEEIFDVALQDGVPAIAPWHDSILPVS